MIMPVEIEPAELGFRRPFTEEVAQVLKIRNANTHPVVFKVKTTAPKQYCVRPNSGRIEPDSEVEVSVLLQAMKQDPSLDTKCRDKFLVQSVPVWGDKEFLSVQEVWDSIEKTSISERKIRVSWLPPKSDAAANAVTPVKNLAVANGIEGTPDAPPPAYASPEPETVVQKVQQQQQQAALARPDSPASSGASATTSAVTAAAAAPGAKAAPFADFQAAAADGQARTPLTFAEPDASMRQRKKSAAPNITDETKSSSSSSDVNKAHPPAAAGATAQATKATTAATTTVQQQAPATEGVPVQLVAILCLVSFLLAYFFF